MSTSVYARDYPHVVDEQKELLDLIDDRAPTIRLLKRRSGLSERRIQRRIRELLAKGWIQQIGVKTEPSAVIRIFALTDEGRRNVPSGT